ncbi:chorismate synthase [Cupriavidus basilensis]
MFEGKTTGTPICLLIRNTDQRSKDYGNIVETFRRATPTTPTGKVRHPRLSRRRRAPSARLTAPVVAAGAVAKKWLREQFGTEIRGYMSQLGEIEVPFSDWSHVPEESVLRARTRTSMPELETLDALRATGIRSARIEVVASNVPVGLGEPLFDRLDADIAHAMMGLQRGQGR